MATYANTAAEVTAFALFLRERELAARWRMSVRTLQRWRMSKCGPNWLKIGSRVVYSMDEIRAFELASKR